MCVCVVIDCALSQSAMPVCAFWYRLCTESEWGVCVSVCSGIGGPLSHTEVCVCVCVCVC